jgi:hypothetical protein
MCFPFAAPSSFFHFEGGIVNRPFLSDETGNEKSSALKTAVAFRPAFTEKLSGEILTGTVTSA